MSIFSKLINNSFPAPVLDIDTSDINVSDANNYIFDFSQIVADDTFEITEQSVNSISIHVLSKDFNGFTLPLTPLYSKLTDNVSFSYSAISNYPKSPYYANGYIEDSEGTRIQIFGGTASVVVPAGKSGYKWLLEPPTGHEA